MKKTNLIYFVSVLLLFFLCISACDKPSNSSNQDTQITVYITKTGEKYHKSSCRYLSKSKISISLKDAKEQGLTPCSVCKPPE